MIKLNLKRYNTLVWVFHFVSIILYSNVISDVSEGLLELIFFIVFPHKGEQINIYFNTFV